jgi:sensor domain CHASE-containing protein
MEPTKAIRWFGPILLAFAIGATIAILVSVVVQSRLMSVEPETRQHIAAQPGKVERPPIVVTIEPARIQVIARRSSSVFDTLADWLPRRGDAS